MKLSLTVRAFTSELQKTVKRKLRRACEDLGVSLASVSKGLDRSEGLAERWVDENIAQHWPVYALASPESVPEPLFLRVFSDLTDMRHEQQHRGVGVQPSPEGASALFLVRAGGAIEEVARALADGKVTAIERPTVLRKLADLETQIASVRRSFEVDERRVS